jgi:hypothetical protein
MKITKLPNGGELEEYNSDEGVYYYMQDSKHWWLNGLLHREDGPAVEYADGTKYWYINDIQLDCTTQKQFEQLMRLRAFW